MAPRLSSDTLLSESANTPRQSIATFLQRNFFSSTFSFSFFSTFSSPFSKGFFLLFFLFLIFFLRQHLFHFILFNFFLQRTSFFSFLFSFFFSHHPTIIAPEGTRGEDVALGQSCPTGALPFFKACRLAANSSTSWIFSGGPGGKGGCLPFGKGGYSSSSFQFHCWDCDPLCHPSSQSQTPTIIPTQFSPHPPPSLPFSSSTYSHSPAPCARSLKAGLWELIPANLLSVLALEVVPWPASLYALLTRLYNQGIGGVCCLFAKAARRSFAFLQSCQVVPFCKGFGAVLLTRASAQ